MERFFLVGFTSLLAPFNSEKVGRAVSCVVVVVVVACVARGLLGQSRTTHGNAELLSRNKQLWSSSLNRVVAYMIADTPSD